MHIVYASRRGGILVAGLAARVNTSGQAAIGKQREQEVGYMAIKPQGLDRQDGLVAKALACKSNSLTSIMDPTIPHKGGRKDLIPHSCPLASVNTDMCTHIHLMHTQ